MGKRILNHPPGKSPFLYIGAMVTIPRKMGGKNDIVLPTCSWISKGHSLLTLANGIMIFDSGPLLQITIFIARICFTIPKWVPSGKHSHSYGSHGPLK